MYFDGTAQRTRETCFCLMLSHTPSTDYIWTNGITEYLPTLPFLFRGRYSRTHLLQFIIFKVARPLALKILISFFPFRYMIMTGIVSPAHSTNPRFISLFVNLQGFLCNF